MTLIAFAIRNLLRRSIRSALSLLGIALAVGSAIALFALGDGIVQSVDRGLDERGASLVVTQRGKTDIFGGTLAATMAPQLAAIPGINAVSGELLLFTSSGDGRHVLVNGWSKDSFGWATVPLARGRLPAEGSKEILIGDSLAESLSKGVGDRLDLFEDEFTIVGISRYQAVLNRGMAIMPLDAMQQAASQPGRVTGFYIKLDQGLKPERIAAIRADLAKAGPVMVSSTRDALEGDRNIKVLNAVSLAVSIIALVTAALNVLNTLLISVHERTREIGTLAAIGWSDGMIVRLILVEGLLLGGLGCLIGVGFGLIASRAFSAIPTIGAYITFDPTPATILPPLAAAAFVCILGAIYPALRAVRMMPADALRSL